MPPVHIIGVQGIVFLTGLNATSGGEVGALGSQLGVLYLLWLGSELSEVASISLEVLGIP